MAVAWRLVKTKYLDRVLDGEGARLYGGRWNTPGLAVVYASQSLSLAELEVLVHLQDSSLFTAYSAVRLSFPDALIEDVPGSSLPDDWRREPPPVGLQGIGDAWIAARTSAVLRVPSAVVPGESNFLLNPRHPDFAKVVADPPEKVELDPRLKR